MTDAKLYAWVFLSVSEQPASLWKVIAQADGINKAIPMLEELQAGFGWLQAQRLVRKEDKMYSLTEAGVALRKSASHGNIFSTMDAIAERFSGFPETGFQPDDITQKELYEANELYRKHFTDAFGGKE